MEQPVITFALAKGRLAEQAFDLLEQLGIDCSEPRNPGRQLVLWDKKQNVRFTTRRKNIASSSTMPKISYSVGSRKRSACW